jgi:hypothetical protein
MRRKHARCQMQQDGAQLGGAGRQQWRETERVSGRSCGPPRTAIRGAGKVPLSKVLVTLSAFNGGDARGVPTKSWTVSSTAARISSLVS